MRLALSCWVEIAAARTAPIFASSADCKPKQAAISNASLVGLVAILLSILHGAPAVTAAMEKSPTFDEPAHLTAGYNYWLKSASRLDPENGDLPAPWAALPLLFSQPNFPSTESSDWKQGDAGRVSQRFFYRTGNDSDRLLLLLSRMMIEWPETLPVIGSTICE